MTSVSQLFRQRVRKSAPRVALRHKLDGAWHDTTWKQWERRSDAISAGLMDRGIEVGDRVAIAARTRLEWVLMDLAILNVGAVTVPIYPTLAAEQAQYLARHSEAKLVLCDSQTHAGRLFGDDGPPTICCDDAGPHDTLAAFERAGERLLDDPPTRQALTRRGAALGPESLATLVYSSGTTGNPKGVMLSHGNLCFEAERIARSLPLGEQDEQLLFLPLAHIFGRMLICTQLATGMATSFAESTFKALDNMVEVNPTLFASVPRLFEKIYAVSQQTSQYDGKVRERLFRWAFQVADGVSDAKLRGKRVPRIQALQHRYADKIVLSRIRNRFGRRLRFAVSGGAPLSRELSQWFHAAGITILEVYGLTECSGGATLNRLERFAFGSAGYALPDVEVRVSDDGEVQIRGPNVMQGYWKDDVASAEAIDDDGWLKSGDLGELRTDSGQGPDPMLYITGRRKDLIVTAGGKNIAPGPIQQRLQRSPWIDTALVFGDAKPHLVALIELDADAVAQWARDNDLAITPEQAHRDDRVCGLIATEMQLANQRLAPFEQLKRWAILPRTLSAERGELTDTMKVKRRVVADHFAPLIESLYE